ncbi:hypothetical protein ACH42_11705 [Endozoicomonas sp. (ex Bugula neritina AB1)]|nr:hypothetical protein ACH42_11705 [Endozoicomonas sp. (ex Bugula neritina AB1)]
MLGLSAHANIVDISGAPAFPDVLDEKVKTSSSTKRDVVLLGSDLLEIAGALGAYDRIVARPRVAGLDVPDTIPHVFKERPGTEGIMALRPSVVIASNGRFQRLFEQLNRLGVNTLMIDPFLPANERVIKVAAALNLEPLGEQLSQNILNDYKHLPLPDRDAKPLKIIHVSSYGAGGDCSVGGLETPADQLIKRVGAVNPAGDIGLNRYRKSTQEGMVLMQPDVILFSIYEVAELGGVDEIWNYCKGLVYTPAGKNKRIILMRDMHVRAAAASSGIATRALAEALNKMFTTP